MVLLALTMAACSGSGNGGSKSDKIINDNGLMRMHITAPEGYESVERNTLEDLNANVTEQDLNYSVEDGKAVDFTYLKDTVLGELVDLSQLETLEVNGNSYYYYPYGSDHMAFIQIDNDLGGVDCITDAEDGKDQLVKILEGITITSSMDTAVNDHDLYDIKYEIDNSLPLFQYGLTASEDAQGKLTKKSVAWYFGDADETLYRMLIRVYPDTELESLLSESYEYDEKEINGITFTEQLSDSEAPFNYYVKHGSDVYQIRNLGVSNGWFTSRSDESVKVLVDLLNSISFE